MEYWYNGMQIKDGSNMESFINSGDANNTYDEWKVHIIAQKDLNEQNSREMQNEVSKKQAETGSRHTGIPNWLRQQNEEHRRKLARRQEMIRDIERNPTLTAKVYTEQEYKYAYDGKLAVKMKFIHNNKNCKYLGNSKYINMSLIGKRTLEDFSGRNSVIRAFNKHINADKYHTLCPICYPDAEYSSTDARRLMEIGFQNGFKQGFYAAVAGGGIFMQPGGYIHKKGCIHIKGRGQEDLGFHTSIDSAKSFVENKFNSTKANHMFPCCDCFSKELGLDSIKNLRTVHFRCKRHNKTDVTIHGPNCIDLESNDPDLLISPYASTAKTAFKMLRDGGFNLTFCKKCLPYDIEQQVNAGKIGTQRPK